MTKHRTIIGACQNGLVLTQDLVCLIVKAEIEAGEAPGDVIGGNGAIRWNLDQHAADRRVRIRIADRGKREDPHARGLVRLGRVPPDEDAIDQRLLLGQRSPQPRGSGIPQAFDELSRPFERPGGEVGIRCGGAQTEQESPWRAVIDGRGEARLRRLREKLMTLLAGPALGEAFPVCIEPSLQARQRP
jgi:hypothetical protein